MVEFLVELKEERLRKSLSEAKNHWQGQKDLNPRHAVLETAALPTELCPYTNDAHNAYLALWASALELLSRFELLTSSLPRMRSTN